MIFCVTSSLRLFEVRVFNKKLLSVLSLFHIRFSSYYFRYMSSDYDMYVLSVLHIHCRGFILIWHCSLHFMLQWMRLIWFMTCQILLNFIRRTDISQGFVTLKCVNGIIWNQYDKGPFKYKSPFLFKFP